MYDVWLANTIDHYCNDFVKNIVVVSPSKFLLLDSNFKLLNIIIIDQ